MPHPLSSNELEAANRAEATALLIRSGYRIYRPEADVHGEDLVLRAPSGGLLPLQLKGRPTVDWPRYGGRHSDDRALTRDRPSFSSASVSTPASRRRTVVLVEEPQS
jgi:hypothetical protein